MPKISDDVLQVLDAGRADGSKFFLIGNFDRKLYTETNKVLEAAGGKWNRSAKAHVFDGDADEALELIILTGEYARTKQDFGQFDTPGNLAADIVRMAEIEPGMHVLEPNAGIGNLVLEIERHGGRVSGFEIDAKRHNEASGRCKFAGGLRLGDFLDCPAEPTFARVVMNPPFAKQEDIKHVLHAFKFLMRGGRLVAIMSAGVMFRENQRAADFRSFVAARGGEIRRLPEDSFKASGTGVNTCVVTIPA